MKVQLVEFYDFLSEVAQPLGYLFNTKLKFVSCQLYFLAKFKSEQWNKIIKIVVNKLFSLNFSELLV